VKPAAVQTKKANTVDQKIEKLLAVLNEDMKKDKALTQIEEEEEKNAMQEKKEKKNKAQLDTLFLTMQSELQMGIKTAEKKEKKTHHHHGHHHHHSGHHHKNSEKKEEKDTPKNAT